MIRHGDCLDVMAGMDPESVDAIVTDPPYGLEFMGKEWDRLWVTSPNGQSGRIGGRGGMDTFGKRPTYQAGTQAQAFHARWAEAAYRVAKPSAYLLAFGGTRTVHRMTVALEDAGWIIRDMLVWGYASGFPKSKASLKPAWEPIVMARKPGPSRVLNIDECRIPGSARRWTEPRGMGFSGGTDHGSVPSEATEGRWPANIVLTDPIFDGGWDGVVGGGETVSRFFVIPKADRSDREPTTYEGRAGVYEGRADGSLAGAEVRRRNIHPTVKPIDLMRHLVRLVTPPGGLVLDPFLGSGTTAIAKARLYGVQRGLGLPDR